MLRAMRTIIAPLLLCATTLAFCVALIVIPSCGSIDCKDPKNGSNAKCAVENAVVDCTTATAQDFVAQHLGDITKFFGPGGVDWAAVEQALVGLVVPEAICVIETAWSNYFATPTPVTTDDAGVPVAAGSGSGSGLTASTVKKTRDLSSDEAKKTALVNKLWPGKKAKLAAGGH